MLKIVFLSILAMTLSCGKDKKKKVDSYKPLTSSQRTEFNNTSNKAAIWYSAISEVGESNGLMSQSKNAPLFRQFMKQAEDEVSSEIESTDAPINFELTRQELRLELQRELLLHEDDCFFDSDEIDNDDFDNYLFIAKILGDQCPIRLELTVNINSKAEENSFSNKSFFSINFRTTNANLLSVNSLSEIKYEYDGLFTIKANDDSAKSNSKSTIKGFFVHDGQKIKISGGGSGNGSFRAEDDFDISHVDHMKYKFDGFVSYLQSTSRVDNEGYSTNLILNGEEITDRNTDELYENFSLIGMSLRGMLEGF